MKSRKPSWEAQDQQSQSNLKDQTKEPTIFSVVTPDESLLPSIHQELQNQGKRYNQHLKISHSSSLPKTIFQEEKYLKTNEKFGQSCTLQQQSITSGKPLGPYLSGLPFHQEKKIDINSNSGAINTVLDNHQTSQQSLPAQSHNLCLSISSQSAESGEDQQDKTNFLSMQVPKRKPSYDASENSYPTFNCGHCCRFYQKYHILSKDFSKIMNKNKLLQDQLDRMQQKTKEQSWHSSISNEDSLSNKSQEMLIPIPDLLPRTSQQLIRNLIQLGKILTKIQTGNQFYIIDITDSDIEMMELVLGRFHHFLGEIGGLADSKPSSENNSIRQNRYRRVLQKIVRQNRQRQTKMQQNFRDFMQKIAAPERKAIQTQTDSEFSFIIRADNSHQMEPQLTGQQRDQFKKQIQTLQKDIIKYRLQIGYYEKQQKHLAHKYKQQLAYIAKQRDYLRGMRERYDKQLAQFIQRIVKMDTKVESFEQFFKNISRRVFEVSNCIPFEDNDQQHLFAPENQSELLEMIEHIRKFYTSFDQFATKKQAELQNNKSQFIRLLKQLIDQRMVSNHYLLELIERNRLSDLQFIKDYIIQKGKFQGQREKRHSLKSKSLKIDKVSSVKIEHKFKGRNQ